MVTIQQIIIAIIIFSIELSVIIIFYNLGRSKERQNTQEKQSIIKKMENSIISYKDTLSDRNLQIKKLNDLKNRYLTFTEHLSDVVKKLYSSLSSKETSAIVISLVRDIINTDIVEMYIFDPQENALTMINQFDKTSDEKISYYLGEGLIGRAAQDGIIKIKGVTFAETRLNGRDSERLSMVAPIKFKDQLIGVLAIGHVKNPNGNERNLLEVICDIAGVTMANQLYLKEWKHGAIKDSLTGLYNRRYFSHMVNMYIEKSIMEKISISICLFDIDHFKNYNDTNGHQEGDRLLKEISNLLISLSRKNSVIARYGGEEFIVLLPDISLEDAFIYAERVQKEIAAYQFLHREKQPLGFVSVSGGVASFPTNADSIEKTIKLADNALYKAKNEGRNRIIKHEYVSLSDKAAV